MGQYDITYGERYSVVKGSTTTVIAKHVRLDIKEALREGRLPRGLKMSVRTKYHSGGSSLSVNVTACPVRFLNAAPDPVTGSYRDRDRYTDEGKAILETLRGIVAAYNYDGSDSMTDYYNVNFYAHVDFGWEMERDARLQLNARAALREA